MALFRGLEEPENVGYYAVIRFTQDIAYNYHNSVKRTASIIQRSHGGHECAFLPDVQRIEGDERRLYGYGVLYFPNFDAAKYWYECTNEVRQQDWLWSADIVIVPARGAFDKGMAVLEINDWSAFRDQTAFEDEYLKGLNNTTEGRWNIVACPDYLQYRMRSSWSPKYLVINQWSDVETWRSYRQAHGAAMHSFAQTVATGSVQVGVNLNV
ncbi:hypothetical protein BOX15_Mlig015604g2 [Macrostomum lignano]|uniref:Uncharacterized protein n=1 Tax=Macrostomum lignano TaxID=282301 RepID=A0A267FPC5_9PLAT|nr:hypothetical protein BOX15_Mlig015604g3 [Macrostomum lignano]PAA82437.1 hypothetical protein BOX15_Mlig015604g2 [Macrostomum lignano]